MVNRPSTFVLGWVVAAVLAVTVGVMTIVLLSSSMRERGAIGSTDVGGLEGTSGTATRETAGAPVTTAAPAADLVSDVVRGEWGEFEVACDGASASTVAVRPAQGWRVTSHEAGPDDDVDAVLVKGATEVEVSVFCNRGRPTVDEIEYDELGDG